MSAERWALGMMESTFLCALNFSQAPPRFDAARFQAARNQLQAKRLRMMAKAWPSLPQALGDDWPRQALTVLQAMPRRGNEHAMTDGFLVATNLGMRGRLPAELRIQMLHVKVRYRWSAGELVARRQPSWLLNLTSWVVRRLIALYFALGAKARFVLWEG
ncbi:MAG: hypothetical protein PVSMB9_01630 [Candidatus Dormibacteria bacterium]